VELITLSEFVGDRRVLEVPHERSRIEEVDCGYADGMARVEDQSNSLYDVSAPRG
jgi:hypothetical protein